ncbi:aspartate/glutamate racemase family protein [Aliagarivorans marinus]|uniref:aspartate/glutamate racemase family protein n=1 Tax=Aliagarivorans marinus TaxID=561965 RepID=UPI0003FF0AE6|nr:aspartate/glutamate racemase family protein [Aliagarivorans marinus]
MKINLINPNTCQGMTDKIATSAAAICVPDSEIIAQSPEHGPLSIECAFDEALAGAAVLDCIAKGEQAGVDAHIIACFGDPAIDACRELASAPVIGIAGAAFQLASLVASRFSVVTTLSRTLPASHHLLQRYGYQHICTSVRASDIAVLDLEAVSEDSLHGLLSECQQAVEHDGAEAIVLGCAGMSDLVSRLQQALPVPVIDGVAAAVKLAESLVQLGLKTAKTGNYAAPLPKQYTGRYQHWSQ